MKNIVGALALAVLCLLSPGAFAACTVNLAPNATPSTQTLLATQPSDQVVLKGGCIDSTPIGQNTTAAGSFTTLTASTAMTVPSGGTGAATLTAHGVLMGEGTSAVAASAAGTSGQAFVSGGASADGAYSNALQAPNVTSGVNGVLVTNTITGSDPTIGLVSGADANRNVLVQGTGTGIIKLGQTICTVTGTTPQTCNGQRGIVTTGTLTTAAVTNAAFVINNSSVATTSLVMCTDQGYSGTLVTNGEPVIITCVPGNGTITANITNVHAANAMNGTVQIGFAVLN